MRKIISVLLSSVMLLSILSCFAVSATEVPYPPLETGHYGDIDTEKYPVEYPDRKREKLVLDELSETQIKDDYYKIHPECDYDSITVDYYGTLSDGSMLVFVESDMSLYLDAVDYMVIGKYLYVTSSIGRDIKIYSNNTFTSIINAYQNGTLSDELLDETAEILCFARFVTPNEEIYPPLESGHYGAKIYFKPYSFETTDNEPISFDDACMLQMDKFNNPATLSDESVENQIKEDYIANVDNNADIEKMEINYYGTLSDGSMLVFVDCKDSSASVIDYTVIGKYVYYIPNAGRRIVLYNNHEFTDILDAYQNGTLSDELLDETAEILCFARFVKTNVEPEPQVLYGDVDRNGVITIMDATLVQKLGIGIEEPESELISVLADVNNDGRISITDVTCIQKYIAGGYGNTGRTGIAPLVVG
ncbi:dockerin type I repeat-containing protein [Ruminococcus sp.]|uniref:dockerin type I repeat-containing protein n=1 Tax=Ruminococcus sp. TaxID=41978 RepID=UPI003F05D29F